MTPPTVVYKTNYVAITPVSPAIAEHIPGVRLNGPSAVAPFDAAEVLLTRMGLHANKPDPVPDEGSINVTGLYGQLRNYQKDAVRLLCRKLRLDGGHLLADDMGLGKTVQTLATWEGLGRPYPLLICCPASVRRTWANELRKWLPQEQPLIAETGAQLAKADSKTRILVTSYTLASTKIPPAFTPHMIVLDEAHLLTGRRAERNRDIADMAKCASYRLALTGTPQWSRPRDWWQLLHILFGYRFGNANEFDYAYCNAFINKWGGKDNKGISRADEFKTRIAHVMLRRVKSDVAKELPPITRQVKWVPSTATAKRASEAFVLGNLKLYHALESTLVEKIEVTVGAMVEAGKSLVFTWQRAHAEELWRQAMKAGVQCRIITGADSHAQRNNVIEQAAKNGDSIIATIDSVGTGVDGLQHVADTVIFHALDYVPIKMAQAEARLHRIGQQRPVTSVFIAMQDTVDEQVLLTIMDKLEQWNQLTGDEGAQSMAVALAGSQRSDEALVADILEAFSDDTK